MDSVRPFRAFVSYCHADAAFAARLQRRLESYRLPRRLADRVDPLPGQSPGRIGPVFRDREDLSAAQDLSSAVREAIARSSALIVVASPDSVRSYWVSREIALFRELHPTALMLVALARGEPGDVMPEALRADGVEPLAADFRPEGDGKRLAFLKIVASLADLPLDALVQRDAQRRLRRVMAVTLGVFAITLLMIAITAFALVSREQAVRERNQAEGLIEFMLTDLREKLRGVGRLDVMEQVNQRAMAYYAAQGDLSHLPDDSLLRRARILHAIGEDDDDRGRGHAALAKFTEAHRATSMLLARRPHDTDRIFAHAQSEFWLGSAAWKIGDFATARRRFEQYSALAQRLIEDDPGKKDWQMEGGYADSNLGTLAFKTEKRPDLAKAAYERSITYFETAQKLAPNDPVVLRELADGYGWLADALRDLGHPDLAYIERLKERALLDRLAATDPKNAKLLRDLVGSSVGLARLEVLLGRPAMALSRLREAQAAIGALAARDPLNQAVARQRVAVTIRLATLLAVESASKARDRKIIASALRSCAATLGKADQKRLCDELRNRVSSVSSH
ncbi:toll/interleukin-1 receptor domain-containing protein [Sphingomonas sp. ZT3P38]